MKTEKKATTEKTDDQLEQELETKKQAARALRGEKFSTELTVLCNKYNCELLANIQIIGQEIRSTVVVKPN